MDFYLGMDESTFLAPVCYPSSTQGYGPNKRAEPSAIHFKQETAKSFLPEFHKKIPDGGISKYPTGEFKRN